MRVPGKVDLVFNYPSQYGDVWSGDTASNIPNCGKYAGPIARYFMHKSKNP